MNNLQDLSQFYNVMYHYVLNEKEEHYDGIFPVWEKEFERQIKWLNSNFEILNPTLLSKDLTNTKIYKSSKRKCIITFDDGSKDQMRNAVRVLDKYSIKGCFYVLSDVLVDKVMPIAQLLHLVLCYFKPDKIIDHLYKYKLIDSRFDKDINKIAIDTYYYEKDVERAYLKYIVNYYVDSSSKLLKECLVNLMSEFFTEQEMTEYWFMSIDELKSIQKNGHMIGNHGRIHRPYESMSYDELKDDIETSHNKLTSIFDIKIDSYAHPFGGDKAVKNRYAISILEKLGYKTCFNEDERIDESAIAIFSLPRFDAYSLPEYKDS